MPLCSVYNESIKQFLTEGPHSTFTSLQSNFHLIARLSYKEPGIPRFVLSPDHKSFTVDGHPILMQTYITNIHNVIALAEEKLRVVLCRCPLDDLDDVIRRSLDLTDPTQWPRDRPRQDVEGYSFLVDTDNPFHPFVTAFAITSSPMPM